ncbi:MAG: CsbD family protein, partial [Candidatus Dormibacteraeota bacterium]|nr:CsbD family protein [Candidatus Dormibacteraeota bacterium]
AAVPPKRGSAALATTQGEVLVSVVDADVGITESDFKGGLMKEQVRGKSEEIKGKVTGNRTEETKGKLRQQVGKVKRTVRNVKEDVRNA